MREQIKQQIRNSIVTLGRAEAILDSRSKMRDEEAVSRILGDMQETAIAVGTAIEELEGEGKVTVTHLEAYCELLWQYMVAETLPERFQLGRALAGKRGEISKSLEQEIEGRLNVVFLLCKAERWSYMEELWRIAGNTPGYDCQAAVSSYSSRLPGGAGGMTHDEAGMIPESVGAVDYDTFDIQALTPDLVFIEGPYAEAGTAGAVPDYDFDEVRAAASVLIYMPVHQEGEPVSETDARLLPIEQADIIIVSSESIKREYGAFLNRTPEGKALYRKIQVSEPAGQGKMLEACRKHSAFAPK